MPEFLNHVFGWEVSFILCLKTHVFGVTLLTFFPLYLVSEGYLNEGTFVWCFYL